MVIDDVRIFDHAVSLSELKTNSGDAVLAIDFETDTKNGESFYAVGLGGRTYGVIWPDREIQPELNQMKKSGLNWSMRKRALCKSKTIIILRT